MLTPGPITRRKISSVFTQVKDVGKVAVKMFDLNLHKTLAKNITNIYTGEKRIFHFLYFTGSVVGMSVSTVIVMSNPQLFPAVSFLGSSSKATLPALAWFGGIVGQGVSRIAARGYAWTKYGVTNPSLVVDPIRMLEKRGISRHQNVRRLNNFTKYLTDVLDILYESYMRSERRLESIAAKMALKGLDSGTLERAEDFYAVKHAALTFRYNKQRISGGQHKYTTKRELDQLELYKDSLDKMSDVMQTMSPRGSAYRFP